MARDVFSPYTSGIMSLRFWAPFVAVVWSGCAGPRAFTLDPDLVVSVSDARRGLMKDRPYLAHFQKGGLDLYFVAGHHENLASSPTFVLIERAFERFPVASLIVEGRPRAAGLIPPARAERGSTPDEYKWGETAYAVELAGMKKIPATGGEPTGAQQFAALMSAGFDRADALGVGFVQMVPAFRSQGRLKKDGAAALYAETKAWNLREWGLVDDGKSDYAAFLEWHRLKTGKEFDPDSVTYEMLRPDARGAYLQRLSETMASIRNRFLAGVVSEELRARGKVLVVYGNGHHAALRGALEAALGPPVYEGDLSETR